MSRRYIVSSIGNQKGVMLLIVLAMLLVVVILANVIMTLSAGQAKITQHQLNRIQAFYAAHAAMNLAIEQLRTEKLRRTLPPGAPDFNSCPPTDPCTFCRSGCDFIDPNLPASVQRVDIIFCPVGNPCLPPPSTAVCAPPAGQTFCLTVTAVYRSPQ